MKRLLTGSWAIGLIVLLAVAVGAEQTDYAIGSVGDSELKIGLGPRPVAMGEAFVALADDLNTTSWNPAGLSQIKGYNAGFMHNIYLQDTSIEYIAYAQNLFADAGIGASFMMLNFGSIDKTIEENNLPKTVGTFTPMVYTLTLGYGQLLSPAISLGGGAKFYSQNIDTQSYSAVAVDLGALFFLESLGAKGFQAGLAVQNLGTKIGDASLPMNAKAGLAYKAPFVIEAKDTWNILLDVNLPFGDVNYTSANIGTEYWVQDVVAARVGYKVKNTGDLSGIVGLTAGVGAKVPLGSVILNVDYAMLSFGDLGMTHQLALGANFK